jgi:hypothetical protein
MRVLHGPTFMREYEEIWANSNPQICSSSSIIPQLTVVMSMAYHMDEAVSSSEDLPHRTYLKEAAIDLIQAWLEELGRKQRTELSTLQVEVLLLLSRSLRHLYPEKLWSSTGALVRSAMVMGLHMDPITVSGVSPYQVEMRRRLWATILEMDLQASMTAGMPLVVPKLDSYNLVPANLNDVDFDEVSTKLPTSRPLSTLTDSLYQVCLATSLPQRLKALSLVQRSVPNTEEAIELGRKVEECLSSKLASQQCSSKRRRCAVTSRLTRSLPPSTTPLLIQATTSSRPARPHNIHRGTKALSQLIVSHTLIPGPLHHSSAWTRQGQPAATAGFLLPVLQDRYAVGSSHRMSTYQVTPSRTRRYVPYQIRRGHNRQPGCQDRSERRGPERHCVLVVGVEMGTAGRFFTGQSIRAASKHTKDAGRMS